MRFSCVLVRARVIAQCLVVRARVCARDQQNVCWVSQSLHTVLFLFNRVAMVFCIVQVVGLVARGLSNVAVFAIFLVSIGSFGWMGSFIDGSRAYLLWIHLVLFVMVVQRGEVMFSISFVRASGGVMRPVMHARGRAHGWPSILPLRIC